MLRRAAFASVLAILPQLATAVQWKDELRANIRSTYKLCRLHWGGFRPTDLNILSEPGTEFIIRREGVDGEFLSNVDLPVTSIADGRINRVTSLKPLARHEESTRTFAVGERICLFDMDLTSQRLSLFIVSCDKHEVTLHGSTQYRRYRGVLRFQFPKTYLPTAAFKDVRATIEAVISPVVQPDTRGTKTVSLGQSPEQVQGILGKPETIIDLGRKLVYGYGSLKIVFQDGMVADVQ